MTTHRQREANRRNARNSTGPRSASGKESSSGNARRHGLTGAPDEDTVLSWYRVILSDKTAVPDPFEQNPYLRAAADLARAETHLQRVRIAEEQWLSEGEKPLSDDQDLVARRERVLDGLMDDTWQKDVRLQIPLDEQWLLPRNQPPFGEQDYYEAMDAFMRHPLAKVGWDRTGFRILRRLDRAIARQRETRAVAQAQKGQTLARYRASAEARRRTTLARWIDQVTVQARFETKASPPQGGRDASGSPSGARPKARFGGRSTSRSLIGQQEKRDY